MIFFLSMIWFILGMFFGAFLIVRLYREEIKNGYIKMDMTIYKVEKEKESKNEDR